MIKGLKILVVVTILLFLFRGIIYRKTINYAKIKEQRKTEITNLTLKQEIKNRSKEDTLPFDKVLSLSLEMTTNKLSFTTKSVSSNPNELIRRGKANCVGYAGLFSSILEEFLVLTNLDLDYEVRHLRGKLYFMNIDMHQFIKSPFFQDHDYVEVENIKSGEKIYIDPSLSDYVWIDQVTSRNEKN